MQALMSPTACLRLPHRYVVLAVGVFGQSSYAAFFFGLPVLAPALAVHFDLSLRQVGIVLGASEIGSATTVLLWGMLADRIGERIVMTVGLTFAALALAAAASASDLLGLVAALIGAGMSAACVLTASGRVILTAFPMNERGTALAVRQTAPLLVGAAGAVILPELVQAGGDGAALFGLAAFTNLVSK